MQLWKKLDKYFKENFNVKKQAFYRKFADRYGNYLEGSIYHHTFMWRIGDIDVCHKLPLPIIIYYTVGVPGCMISSWQPEVLDENKVARFNPTSVTVSKWQEFIEEINKLKTDTNAKLKGKQNG